MEKGVLATRVWKYGPHKNAGVRMCVCVCVLYYKFILYITRGTPNKAVKKKIEHQCKDLQECSKTLTPCAFMFVCGQYESVAKVKVLSQKSSSEFIL